MTQQRHLLAPDPEVEARVAQIVESVVPECPPCYFKEREVRSVTGSTWPTRTRFVGTAQKPCQTCKTPTYWSSAGPWVIGKRSEKKAIPEERGSHGQPD